MSLHGLALSVRLPLLLLIAIPAFAQPDVIVGDLTGPGNYGNAGNYYAYSAGTTSCNIGTSTLQWIAGTNEHPVIAQHLYRIKEGRIEQIGISWLKHGFTALQGTLCGSCNAHPNGTALGVGCSDPYSASLNGSQGNDNRYEVNAATGVFTYPPQINPTVVDLTYRRLRVHEDDLDPTMNPGAIYLMEGQYVTQDDSAALKHNNNCSYRRCDVNPSNFALSYNGGTVQQVAAIEAWEDFDPTVEITDVIHADGSATGRFIMGTRVADLGNGYWSYEYAVFNQNSDRSGQSFSIPIPAGVLVQNIGFHDVDHHSGSPVDGTDWNSSLSGGVLKWETTQTYAQNQYANALRWGTMYNFRFEANAPPTPTSVDATIDLFKPQGAGEPLFVTMATKGPVTLGSVPDPVTTLLCSVTDFDASLSWINGSATYDSIRISRDGQLVQTLPGNATGWTDFGLGVGTYTYSVVAVEGGIGSASVECTVEVFPPAAPTNFTCTPNGLQALLSWTNTATYDQLDLTRNGVHIATLAGTATGYTDSGLAAGSYTYTLTGMASGVSTATVNCMVTLVPPPPLDFLVSASSPLVAYDPADGAASFTVDVSIDENDNNFGYPNDFAAFSIALTHDATYLSPTVLSLSATVAGLDGGSGPSFFNPTIYPGGVTAGVVFSFDADMFLQATAPLNVLSVDYETETSALIGNSVGVTTDLTFVDGMLGNPLLVSNTVVVGVDSFVASKGAGTVTLSPTAGQAFQRGDANGDGSTNLLDVTTVLAYLFTSGALTCLDAADANDDGDLDISDAAMALDYLFLGGTISAPIGACGPDPTSDALGCDSVPSCP